MHIANPLAFRGSYPAELQQIMSLSAATQSRHMLAPWQRLNPGATPLVALPHLAAQLGVAAIDCKDESVRSPLASFKALGAPVALLRLIQRTWPDQTFAPTRLLTGGYRGQFDGFVVISATDGNHGRALAAAAQSVGCRCVIVIHAHVSSERADAIAGYGAEVIRVSGNYDESVVHAAQLAAANGWHVVSDTSYPGYETIPRDVMQGYSTIACELIEQTDSTPTTVPWTHVFLQGGVGGFAAGVASALWEHFGADRPRFVVVEPREADCLFQSARLGRPATATGSVDSVMAGLACGETSPLAWQFLAPCTDDFVVIPDELAVETMRLVALPSSGDCPLVGGESGVAGLAGLVAASRDPQLAAALGLSPASRVLVVNTEGATAPSVYAELVGVAAETIVAAQHQWHAQ